MNRFEILDETIKKIGASPQDVLQYWLNNNRITKDYLNKLLEVKIEIADDVFSHLRIGWYLFANGKFSPYPDTFPKPIGVVAWMKPDLNAKAGERGIIILFDEYYGEWSSRNLLLFANDPINGDKNTQVMLRKAKALEISVPVAEFCEKVNKTIGLTSAFIPAYKQLDRIAIGYSTICDAFQAVGKTCHPFLFSSTEVDCKQVICMDMTTAKVTENVKTISAHMYPIILF